MMKNETVIIGQELLDKSGFSDLDRKCIVIKQVVRDGDYSLEEALILYQVSAQQYEAFIDMLAQ